MPKKRYMRKLSDPQRRLLERYKAEDDGKWKGGGPGTLWSLIVRGLVSETMIQFRNDYRITWAGLEALQTGWIER